MPMGPPARTDRAGVVAEFRTPRECVPLADVQAWNSTFELGTRLGESPSPPLERPRRARIICSGEPRTPEHREAQLTDIVGAAAARARLSAPHGPGTEPATPEIAEATSMRQYNTLRQSPVSFMIAVAVFFGVARHRAGGRRGARAGDHRAGVDQ